MTTNFIPRVKGIFSFTNRADDLHIDMIEGDDETTARVIVSQLNGTGDRVIDQTVGEFKPTREAFAEFTEKVQGEYGALYGE